ncbi:MAG: protein kinase [Nannocystaceae bacterium]|nr:protein kinase [Nannocystaceae bacterium]
MNEIVGGPQLQGLRVLAGPRRHGSELRWLVADGDGTAVFAQLAAELAREPSVRARWVDDTERMMALDVPAHARPRAIGPQPDPRDPEAPPPWRMRPQPAGEPLDEWLQRHAPLPIDEALALVRAVAAAVAQVHARGAVLRDLQPRHVVWSAPDAMLVDIGLSRTEVLSSRTAASLLLEDSPYTAPECLRRTAVDRRADVYALGVLAYVALTGVAPWGELGAVMRPAGTPVPPSRHRDTLDRVVDAAVLAALADDPERRPGSVEAFVAALEAREPVSLERATITCQACGATVRREQRLCMACGKQAVSFTHTELDAPDVCALVLTKAAEDAAFSQRLRQVLATVGEGEPPALDFLIGDERMYSQRERQSRIRLPVRLFDRLSPQTAQALKRLFAEHGLATRVVPEQRLRRRSVVPASIMVGTVAIAIGLGMLGMTRALVPVVLLGIVLAAAVARYRRRRPRRPDPLMRLRRAPVALPASDPWVARLAATLSSSTAADVRQRVAELALAVQRLVDHRIEHHRERAEIELVTAPIDPLVQAIEREVSRIGTIDEELRALDEGQLVRALARSEARGEPAHEREAIVARLTRLRVLEDARAAGLGRLLDAGALIDRAVAMGLRIRDDAVEHDREVAAALRALEADG